MKPSPDGLWIRIPLSPETLKRAHGHAERIARIVETAPEVVRVGTAMLEACADALAALEKDVNRTAGKLGKKKRRPRARRIK